MLSNSIPLVSLKSNAAGERMHDDEKNLKIHGKSSKPTSGNKLMNRKHVALASAKLRTRRLNEYNVMRFHSAK